MNYFTSEETDEILGLVREATGSASLVEWQYWYRAASYETFELWGIDRQAIRSVLASVTCDDVVKTELQHGNRKSLILILFPWLLPTVGVDAFAYVKLGLQFDSHNRLKLITVLSFKEAGETEPLPVPLPEYFNSFFEWNRSTWLESQPELIIDMQPEKWTQALLILAICTKPELAQRLPRTVWTHQLVNRLCHEDPAMLFYLPTAFWEEWRLRVALQHNPAAIAFVPEKKLTHQLVNDVCLHHPETLLSVPVKLWNERLVRRAVAQQPGLIQDLPLEYVTPTLVDLACQFEPTVLYSLPHEFWCESYLLRAVMVDPMGLAIARRADITDAVLAAALASDLAVVEILPEQLITEQLVLDVVADYPRVTRFFHGTWTQPLAIAAVTANREAAFGVPLGVLPAEMLIELAKVDVRFFPLVPKAAFTQEFIDLILEQQPNLLAMVPKQFKTTHNCLLAVQADASLWEFVPKHLKTRLQTLNQQSLAKH